jgi:hypothetical protein
MLEKDMNIFGRVARKKNQKCLRLKRRPPEGRRRRVVQSRCMERSRNASLVLSLKKTKAQPFKWIKNVSRRENNATFHYVVETKGASLKVASNYYLLIIKYIGYFIMYYHNGNENRI